ncbi:hypothetical protein N9C46_04950, partial [Flavobacteriaceae bacterium]|nr:hypothetical protein [Flavobacteriaceae bacterium]
LNVCSNIIYFKVTKFIKMFSEELISHPEPQPIIKKFKKKFPKIDLESNMINLGWWGYQGMGLDVDTVKIILEKCLKENKYFKVWRMNWKGDISDMPMDWWEGKVAYYKYKG